MIRLHPKEAPQFLASKWLHLDFLVETKEFEALFTELEQVLFLYSTMGVQEKGKNSCTISEFLACWERYLDCLRNGLPIQDQSFRFYFTLAMTKNEDALRALDLPGEREVIIPYEPIVQLQLHRFSYSKTDQKFHSQAFGSGSISWGVRASYPQLFQYPHTRRVEDALDEARFPNASLFTVIRRWLRKVSIPTPFIINNARINVPIRLGKDCFPWIMHHPDLVSKELKVHIKQ